MRRRTAPRRTQPRQPLGIGRCIGPRKRQERQKCTPERGLDEQALLGGIDLKTGLAHLPHEAQPIGRTPGCDDRDPMAGHTCAQGGNHLGNDELGLSALALCLEQHHATGRRRCTAGIRIKLSEAALQGDQVGMPLVRAHGQLGDPPTSRQLGQAADDGCEHMKRHTTGFVREAQYHLGTLRDQPQQLLLCRAEIVEALREQRLPRRPRCHIGAQRLDHGDAHTSAVDHLLLVECAPPLLVLVGEHLIARGAHGGRIEQRRAEPLEARANRLGCLWQHTAE